MAGGAHRPSQMHLALRDASASFQIMFGVADDWRMPTWGGGRIGGTKKCWEVKFAIRKLFYMGGVQKMSFVVWPNNGLQTR